MIDKEIARRIAAEYIGEGSLNQEGFTPVILDNQTIERRFGWVFFYQSREYLETGELSSMLIGNAPLIVDRENGTVHVTGTAKPVEHYLAEYERDESC